VALRRFRSDELENQLNRGALWAITYGDLMSYLMIFFMIMFSFSVSHARHDQQNLEYQQTLVNIQKIFGGKPTTPSYERAVARQKEDSIGDQLEEAVARSRLAKQARVEKSDAVIRLTMADGVLFDSARADLKPGALSLLKDLVAGLKELPNAVVVEGHTDNVPVRGGRYGSNWELSMARAYTVLRYLETQGVAPARLSGVGYGEHRPIGDNATAEGRAKNRRISVALMRRD
jgi:chemotaxis protein MotB